MTEDAPNQRRRLYPAYVDKPIFLNGPSGTQNRTGNIWEQRKERLRRQRKYSEDSGSGSTSGSENSTRSDVVNGTNFKADWMQHSKGMGLQEAFAKIDDEYRPKTAAGVVSTGPMKEKENETGTGSIFASRARRSTSSSIELKEGTPQLIRDMFERAEREESVKLEEQTARWKREESVIMEQEAAKLGEMSARREREHSARLDEIAEIDARVEREVNARFTPTARRAMPVQIVSGSESSGSREPSPSPAARDRRHFNRGSNDIKKLVVEKKSQDGSEKPLSQYEKDRAYRERLLSNPNPVFTKARRRQIPAWALNNKSSGQTIEAEHGVELNGEYQKSATDNPLARNEAESKGAESRRSATNLPLHKNGMKSKDSEYGQSAADIPLPSIEHDSDMEFTGMSVLVSSPKLKIKPPKSDVDPEERITAEAKLFELQDNKSEKPSRSPSPTNVEAPKSTFDVGSKVETSKSPFNDEPSSNVGKHDETPRPKHIPTPRVTGAYIETPAPSSRKLVGQPRRVINTAKRTTAAEDLRRIKLEENIEDSTLDDLDLLLENDAAVAADLMDTRTPVVDLEYDDRGLPLTQAEKERRMERIILERMALRLKNTSSSIRDAREGIERLELEVSTAPVHRTISSDSSADVDDAHYVQINIRMKLPRLYTVYTTPATSGGQNAMWFTNRNWKFTWLGLILFLFSTWYVAETAMCEAFCHPMYSSTNDWSPSDPFFPWAIPTKLDQWTGEVVSGTIKGVETIVMDWYDPDRFKRPIKPRAGYMAPNYWWATDSGPVYRSPERTVAESIYDDEVYDD